MKLNFTFKGILGLLLASGSQLFAQGLPCGTSQVINDLYQSHPEIRDIQTNYNEICKQWVIDHAGVKSNTPIIIPVVFHIIHNYGAENISDAQIQDAMDILNRDYNKRNADTADVAPEFAALIANVGIEFRLAKLDPNGNCTNGIDRVASSKTYIGGDQSKLNYWPRKNYLNIWTVQAIGSAGVAGYSNYPGTVTGSNLIYDGVIILHDYVGSIGTATVSHSRALTHEIGHYLNLPHCWGSTNEPGVACGDDGIFDTPQTKGWNHCPAMGTAAICDAGVQENYQNYMEYSYCSIMFTEGQKQAMLAALNSNVASRNNLWSQANLVQTGVLNTASVCAPVADFYANKRFICKGASVNFTDFSRSGAATSWLWSFPGATSQTSSSTLQNPTNVIYPTGGLFDVTLTVTNATGSNTITIPQYIKVNEGWSEIQGTTIETFETSSADWWSILNPDNNIQQWQHVNFVGASGTNCMMLNASETEEGDINELISPTFDLRYMSNIVFTFKMAGATRNTYPGDITDKMTVWTSSDCGASWIQRKSYSGGGLIQAGYSAANFVPTQNLWTTETIALPSTLAISGLRVKFKFTSGDNTNNFYLDDVNFTGVLGTDELISSGSLVTISPNPAQESTNLTLNLAKASNVNIELFDIVGAKVSDIYHGQQATFSQSYTINRNGENHLSKGIYFVRITVDGKVTNTSKVIFN